MYVQYVDLKANDLAAVPGPALPLYDVTLREDPAVQMDYSSECCEAAGVRR